MPLHPTLLFLCSLTEKQRARPHDLHFIHYACPSATSCMGSSSSPSTRASHPTLPLSARTSNYPRRSKPPPATHHPHDAPHQRPAPQRRRRFSIVHAIFVSPPCAATIFRVVPLSTLDVCTRAHPQHAVHHHRHAQPP
ncbi:hypothetical protein B0H13DRAFT_2118850 [Mycena leptocephala]|nr:hypothetical protein B0H13DRAFT_2118850 [Mycena leptocephala]